MNGFFITVNNGLLDRKHYLAMKEAVWLFMWYLDKMTSISEEGVGKVLGGKPIRYEDVKKELDFPKSTYQRYVDRLRIEGYINTVRTSNGLIVTVNKASKIYKQKRDIPDVTHHSEGNPNMTHPKPEYDTSIYRQDSRQDNIDTNVSIGGTPPKVSRKGFPDKDVDWVLEQFKRVTGRIPADRMPRRVAQNMVQIAGTFTKHYGELFQELRGVELTKRYALEKFYLNLEQKKYVEDLEKLESAKLKLRVYLDGVADKLKLEKRRKEEAHASTYQAG